MQDRYKIIKQVVQGEYYQEHRFKSFPETFVGRWKKVGVQVSPRCEKMLTCDYCFEDYEKRVSYRTTENKYVRTYRVEGVTTPEEVYRWEFGRCENPNFCWGTKTRIWDVRRAKNSSRHYFGHTLVVNNAEQRQDTSYANFVRSPDKNNLTYTAITCKASQSKEFWPDLLPVVENPRRQIHITMVSRGVVPEAQLNTRRDNLSGMWKYPNTMEFRQGSLGCFRMGNLQNIDTSEIF